jgi:hypothetical protein
LLITKCECDEGFEGDGFSCRDVDECKSRGLCVHGQCRNLQGSYECDCDMGYMNPEINGEKNVQLCVGEFGYSLSKANGNENSLKRAAVYEISVFL